MVFSFSRIVKNLLADSPKNDYPVLNTRLFVECWLGYAMDKSLTSMRDLFKRLNHTGFAVNISNFSKASSHRSPEVFEQVYQKLVKCVQRRTLSDKYVICPIDSTTITLTSKLLWSLGHHQVKLFSFVNLNTGATGENLVDFGKDYDYNFGEKMISSLPANGVGVIDRGNACLSFLQSISKSSKYFVLRIGNNYKLEFAQASGVM